MNPPATNPAAPWPDRRPETLEPEWMDAESVPRDRLDRALRFIRIVNAGLGYTRATLRHLDAAARDVPADRPLRVLDVATGSADVPQAIARWARRRRRAVACAGLDLHAATLDHARLVTAGRVPLVRGDALALPFDDAAFDVVMTSMFTHHLPDDLVVRVLSEMRRVASRRVIVADLIRDRRAHRWITLFTALADPMVKHDARLSVRQAFTVEEVSQLARRAGMKDANVVRHFGHRFVMTWRRDRA
jgi:ubiquinone/menaquinone biosynthesis C-methylase UbiE